MARYMTTIWLVVLSALLVAPAALAQDGTQGAGYPAGGVAGDAENRLSTGGGEGPLGAVGAGDAQLPFTGINLVLLVVGGVVLLGLGALLFVRGRESNRTV